MLLNSVRDLQTHCKDVVLLLSPNDNAVLKQSVKLHLDNRKHVIQAVDVPKDVGKDSILEFLCKLFADKFNGTS